MPTITAATGATSINPANDETIGVWPYLDASGVEEAVGRADAAFQIWRKRSHHERAAALGMLAAVLDARGEEFARLITLEMGKPVKRARLEVEKCAKLCRWYAANTGVLLADEIPDLGGEADARVRYHPLGVVLGVMPWNFPLWQVLRAAVPVIAAGNAFVLKHADNVQGCAHALADAFASATFPAGLFANLNINRAHVPGLLADARIAGVSVTAGAAAGAAIAAEAGRNLKKSVLELGGADAFIVLADADLDRAVPAAIEARFQNSGQVCIAAKRFIVEAPIASEFTRRFVDSAAALRVGDPMRDVDMGPLARRRLRSELHEQVEVAERAGARVLLGAELPAGPGAFYPATVLDRVTPDMKVFREETFGPVAPIVVAESAEAALALANDSEFGLSGSIWSADRTRAAELGRAVVTGGIFINAIPRSDPRVPIGGVKASGYGRELSHFGLKEFCNAQLLWLQA